VASTLGWWIGINLRFLLVGILDPLIQSLWQELGLWEVFWLNTVKEPVTLAVFGAFQWLMLRRHLPRAVWWILASAVGGVVEGAVNATIRAVAYQPVAAIVRDGQVSVIASDAVFSGAGWAGYGVVTGFALVWLLQHRNRS